VIITLQPSEVTDHITADGTELTKLPYPFHCSDAGLIQRQDFWKGDPFQVVGFVADVARQEVDLYWRDVAWDNEADRNRVVGMYIVTMGNDGMASHVSAVRDVTVTEG